jgi:hypothetical protein
MDFLNVSALLYLAFRLSPVILVCYFLLSSIFNSDIRGLIFLGLMLVEVVITLSIGNFFHTSLSGSDINTNGVCNSVSLTPDGPLSKYFPLSLNVLSFTFGYLVNIVYQYDLILSNIPMVIVFSSFILYNCVWLFMNTCSDVPQIFGSLSLGFGFGWLFSYFIGKSGIVDLQFFNGVKNNQVCKRASNQKFKCTSTVVI